MNQVLYGYSVSGATWIYLSALLIVGVYFRFNRLWSRRNLDLVLLLALSPGLLLIEHGAMQPDADAGRIGYTVLLLASAALLVRVLLDPFARWRPRFEQNMNSAGMLWLIICALVFLGTRAIADTNRDSIPSSTEQTVARGDQLLNLQATGEAAEPAVGPTGPLVAAPLSLMFAQYTPSIFAISSHLAIVFGLLYLGRTLIDDFGAGVAMAALYLLLPCTAFNVGEVTHVLPSAFLLWAIALWKRPAAAGVLVAFACGTLVFPVFLLPLWFSFYGKRGWKRFSLGFVACAVVLFGSYALISRDVQQFVEQTTGVMEWYRLGLEAPVREATAASVTDATSAGDFWRASNYWEPYRLPVIAAFAVLVIVMTAWPRPKTVELLLAQLTAVMIAVQFWLPDRSGTYVLWYLPSLLTLMFRPRLPVTFAEAVPVAVPAKPIERPSSSTTVPASSSLR